MHTPAVRRGLAVQMTFIRPVSAQTRPIAKGRCGTAEGSGVEHQ